MKPLINWEELAKKVESTSPSAEGGGQRWDRSASMYDQMAKMEKLYTLNQLNAFDTDKNDTVLDIGCGPGRISVPMALRSKSVTAIDVSEKMLSYCQKNAESAGLTNLNARLLDWKDAVLGENLEQHDIVIGSRSPGLYDIKKVNSFARKYAVLIAWANAPSLAQICGELFEGAEDAQQRLQPRKADRQLGYNVTFNIIYDLGLEPNVRIVTDGFTKEFESREEAYQDLRRLREFPDDKLPVFKNNVDKWLFENDKGGVTFKRETRSYVIWWEPNPVDY
jgi:precorrin-6B methylase 2